VRIEVWKNDQEKHIIPAKNAAIYRVLESYPNKYIAFLDSNSIPEKHWLDKLVHSLESDSFDYKGPIHGEKSNGIGCVAGLVVDKAKQDTTRIVALGHYQDSGATLHLGWGKPQDKLNDLCKEMESKKVYCSCLCACVFTEKCLREMTKSFPHALNPKLEHYYGCPDLGLKMYSIGYQYGFVKDAICVKNAIDVAKNKDRLIREQSNMRVIINTYYNNSGSYLTFRENQSKKKQEILDLWDSIETRTKHVLDHSVKVNVDVKVGDELDCKEAIEMWKK